MEHSSTLNCLLPGECALVERIETQGGMRRRFLDIGLIENTRVFCVGKSPAGDPSAYLIRGAVIAIRARDCKGIHIRRVGAEDSVWD